MHNPDAGNEEPSKDDLLSALRFAGHEAIYQSTKDDDYEQALDEPADMIAVAGGDGTVRKIASRLVGRGMSPTPIAVLPLGTANNIAKSLGLDDAPLRLISQWEHAQRRRIDVGIAKGPFGERAFLEAAGCGLFCQIMRELAGEDTGFHTSLELHRHLHVLRELLLHHPPGGREYQIQIDGEDRSGRYFLIEALNTKYMGPNLMLAPDADPSDGQFDVVLLGDDERDELATYISRRLEQREEPPRWEGAVVRGRDVRINWDGFDLHSDDKLWPKKPQEEETDETEMIELRLATRALEFVV